MPPAKITYDLPPDAPPSVLREDGIESGFIGTLQALKYEYRRDITNRATLEQIASFKSDPGNGYTKDPPLLPPEVRPRQDHHPLHGAHHH